MTVHKIWSMAAAAALLTGLAVTGCSGPPGMAPAGSACMPPPFSLSAAAASPGGSLTVQAKDATCNPRYGDNAQIHIEVLDSTGTKILELQAPMNDAGGFSTDLLLPETAVPGEAMVTAYPYNLDWCDDTGRNNRVGAPSNSGAQEIQRVSCVMPSQPLTITEKP